MDATDTDNIAKHSVKYGALESDSEKEMSFQMSDSRDCLASDSNTTFFNWKMKTILEKILIIICGLLSILLLIVIILLVTRSCYHEGISKSTETQKLIQYQICTSEICNDTAYNFRFSMDAFTDPCDDFYQFSCGRLIGVEHIKPSRQSISSFTDLGTEIQDRLIGILEDKKALSLSKTMDPAINFYQQCLDTGKMNATGTKPLQDLLKQLIFTPWPIGISDEEWKNDTMLDKDTNELDIKIISNLINLNVAALMSVDVELDMHDTTKYIIYVKKLKFSQFGLDFNTLLNRTATLKSRLDTKAYENYIYESARIMSPDINDTQLKKDIKDLVDFEAYLAVAVLVSSDEDETLRANIQEVEKQLNVTGFLNKVLNGIAPKAHITGQTKIYMDSVEYFKILLHKLSSTPLRTIANYLGWLVVMEYGSLTVDKFRDARLEYAKVTEGISEARPRNRSCASFINKAYEFATVGEYARRYFPKSEKSELEVMMKEIIEAFEDKVKELTWMDEGTKDKALKKAKNVIDFIAYPNWVLSNKNVDTFYEQLVNKLDGENHFITNVIHSSTFRRNVNLDLLGKTPNRNSWDSLGEITPLSINAYYNQLTNSLHILVGILGGNFYKFGRPASVNYGAIGSVMGHELTHGFDNTGHKFDEFGNLKHWWQNKTLEEYKKKAECFIEEYSEIFDSQAQLHVNGNLTLGENIADNGGISKAFVAYKNHVKKLGGENYRLPGLEAYSSDQLFFISYGNVWCGKQRTPLLKWQINQNEHAPSKYRVNVVARNSEEFSRAFNCKVGSKMNPKDKCKIW